MSVKVIFCTAGLTFIILSSIVLLRSTNLSIEKTTAIVAILEQNQQLLKAQAIDLDNCHWQLLRLQGVAECLLEHFEICSQKGGSHDKIDRAASLQN